jgi:hypothetical protein
VGAYLAKTIFAECDFAREAAFLCTTPDLTARSIADVYAEAAAFAAAASPAFCAVSSFLWSVFNWVLTPLLRAVRRTVLRAALMADFVLAIVDKY